MTDDGERLQLRRYDGPSMRDEVLESMAGQDVVVDGLRRDRLVIAKAIAPAPRDSVPPEGAAEPKMLGTGAAGAGASPRRGDANDQRHGRSARRC